MTKIMVKETEIRLESEDYISLIDKLKAKDSDFFIADLLRNRNAVEFLNILKHLNNHCFNYGEYTPIRNTVRTKG